MISSIRILGLTASLLLAACGGGGGGGDAPAPAPTQAVAVTETSAKPVGANALDVAQNTSSTQSAGLVTGVEVQAGGSVTPNNLRLIAKVARDLTALPIGSGGSLATGVSFSETQACPVSGTLTVSGNIAGQTLAAGDTVGYIANNCKMFADGETLNGGMSITIVSGSLATPPYQLVMSVTVTNLSITSGTSVLVVSGDMRFDLSTSSTGVETLTVSGSSMSNRITEGSKSRTVTLKNYSQTVTANGTSMSSSLTAAVETTSTSLGATGGSFTISTPTAVVWNAGTNLVTAGVIRVVGAGNSVLVLTINSDGTVTLEIDADGNGSFEKTISTTVSELRALL